MTLELHIMLSIKKRRHHGKLYHRLSIFHHPENGVVQVPLHTSKIEPSNNTQSKNVWTRTLELVKNEMIERITLNKGWP